MIRVPVVALAAVMSLIAAAPLRAEGNRLTVPTVIFSGAAAVDWATTYRAQQRGWREANPMLSWANGRPRLMVTVGAAGDIAGVWAWNRYVGRKHPKLATVGLYVGAGLRTWLAVRNTKAPQPCSAPVPYACH